MRSKHLLFLGSLLVASLAGAGAWLYSRHSRVRIPSQESLDDPEAAKAFGEVTKKPPWHLMRWYIARHALNLKDCGEAIDLGCGPGQLVITLARRSRDLRITGVDLSTEMLKQAEAYAIESGVEDRVSFKVGNAQEIPFDDHSVDLVVSTLSLHHWKNPIAVMNEIARVLRPEGVYIIFDLRRDIAAPVWLFLWLITHFIAPGPLRQKNEPMGSRDAAYSLHEAARLVEDSDLQYWKINKGALWLMIVGKM